MNSEREGDSRDMLSANMMVCRRQAKEEEERGTDMKTENLPFLWISGTEGRQMDKTQ